MTINPLSLDSFCSVLSMRSNEPLAGTAMSAKQYILISWPKKFWARDQFESQHFPSGLSNFLKTLQKEKRVLTRLIHQHERESREYSQLFIMPDSIAYEDVSINDIEDVLRRYFDNKPDDKYLGNKTERSYIFCCTHGKRDRCCAKFGQSVFTELRRIAAEKEFNLDVWECTHLVADRLSAVAMAFPHGYMYGRMRVENAPDIIEYLIKGYPYPPCYRGQLGLGSVEQTAQAFGHFYWFENKIENAEVILESVQQEMDEYKAYVTIKDKNSIKRYANLTLTLRKINFSSYGHCEEVKENKPRNVSQWVVSESHIDHC